MNVETALLTGREVVTELQRVTDEDAEKEGETENDTEGEVEAGIVEAGIVFVDERSVD